MLKRIGLPAFLYLLLCLAAVAIGVLGTPAIAGESADPVSWAFAALLALPWVTFIELSPRGGAGIIIILVSMLMNFAILLGVARLARRWRVRA